MVKHLFIFLIISFPIFLFAQSDADAGKKLSRKEKIAQRQAKIDKIMKQEEEGALVFNKQSALAIKLNTDGYGILYEHGKYKTINSTNLWFLELGERKHPKEEKLSSPNTLNGVVGNPFIYGKQNNFYYFKVGFGKQKLLGGKGNKNGVAVSAIYTGGLSLGMLKPYYLEVYNSSTKMLEDVKYTNNDSVFLNPNFILGSSGFGKGFGEIKFVPGAFINTALRFDYGRYNDMVSAIDVGLNIEFYTQKMPILLLNKSNAVFFNAYISILFGRRK